ncbi:NAD(P)/FAD-dependent oxidoreductase [Neolewinella aurantiaca]|nr:FAD-dependent oxidoreductase [Neolewinella aurantiaca]
MNSEDKNYDVIVIGGGPAGSTTATTLARKGHDVLLLEKARFPREHVGESLLPFCYQVFEELGVLDKMEANFSRKPGVTFSNYDGTDQSHWCFSHVINDPSYLSFHVHRAKFDDILLRNSEANGVEVAEEMSVRQVDFTDDGKGVNVSATDANGEDKTFKGRFVVDASGQTTLLARQFGSKKPFESLKPRAAISCHWLNANLEEDLAEGNIKIVHLEGEKLGWIWMIPLANGRLSMGVAANMTYVNARRRELSKAHDNWQEAFYLEELRSSPVVARTIEGASLAQPVAANGDFSYYAAEKYGDRFAIVGDAAGFLDPIFSSGIYLGIKGGQRVAEGISALLENNDGTVLEKAYQDVDGAYQLVEKLINTFYEPGSVRFSGVDKVLDQSYKKFETAYSILHLVLAGDFFSNHQKYIKAIELLRDKSMIDKYRNLIKHPVTEVDATVCRRKEESVITMA